MYQPEDRRRCTPKFKISLFSGLRSFNGLCDRSVSHCNVVGTLATQTVLDARLQCMPYKPLCSMSHLQGNAEGPNQKFWVEIRTMLNRMFRTSECFRIGRFLEIWKVFLERKLWASCLVQNTKVTSAWTSERHCLHMASTLQDANCTTHKLWHKLGDPLACAGRTQSSLTKTRQTVSWPNRLWGTVLYENQAKLKITARISLGRLTSELRRRNSSRQRKLRG